MSYGLISRVDADAIKAALDVIMQEFPNETINTLEIGLYAGETGNFIRKYIESKGRTNYHTGIDNNRDGEVVRFPPHKFIQGNSNEVFNKIGEQTQHFILQDACHCFSCAVSSHFCYSPKVKIGGFMAWHDTGKHIKQFKDFQHGDSQDPMAYISVRSALLAIGLFNYEPNLSKWELVADVADTSNDAGGICIFKKLY